MDKAGGRDRKPVLDVLNPVHHLRVMGRLIRRQVKKPGTAAGTLVHRGPQKVPVPIITFLDYNGETINERQVTSIDECFALRDTATVSWINVEGLHDVSLIERAGEWFGLHPLVLEDIVHVGQRPKLEEYDGYLYIVLDMLTWDTEARQVVDEQVSMVLGPRYLFTFQERAEDGDVFDSVREQIRVGKARIRSRGPDFLAYALIDAVVDNYFAVLEAIGEETERLEIEVVECPVPETMARLHALKREMIMVRRATWPLRDMLNELLRTDSKLVTQQTKVFLRDVHDHTIQVIDALESVRDVVSGMIDVYLSSVSQRTNEVMKVLTVMASIFIPLTFLVGVYGMNFEYMPELEMRWAYPALWVLMLGIAFGMLAVFRRKGWI